MVQQAAMMQVAAQATATQAAGAEAQAKAEEPVKGNVRSEAQLRRPA
jgi:hypothetical protein